MTLEEQKYMEAIWNDAAKQPPRFIAATRGPGPLVYVTPVEGEWFYGHVEKNLPICPVFAMHRYNVRKFDGTLASCVYQDDMQPIKLSGGPLRAYLRNNVVYGGLHGIV